MACRLPCRRRPYLLLRQQLDKGDIADFVEPDENGVVEHAIGQAALEHLVVTDDVKIGEGESLGVDDDAGAAAIHGRAENGGHGGPHSGDDRDALCFRLFHIGQVGRDQRRQEHGNEQNGNGTHVSIPEVGSRPASLAYLRIRQAQFAAEFGEGRRSNFDPQLLHALHVERQRLGRIAPAQRPAK